MTAAEGDEFALEELIPDGAHGIGHDETGGLVKFSLMFLEAEEGLKTGFGGLREPSLKVHRRLYFTVEIHVVDGLERGAPVVVEGFERGFPEGASGELGVRVLFEVNPCVIRLDETDHIDHVGADDGIREGIVLCELVIIHGLTRDFILVFFITVQIIRGELADAFGVASGDGPVAPVVGDVREGGAELIAPRTVLVEEGHEPLEETFFFREKAGRDGRELVVVIIAAQASRDSDHEGDDHADAHEGQQGIDRIDHDAAFDGFAADFGNQTHGVIPPCFSRWPGGIRCV